MAINSFSSTKNKMKNSFKADMHFHTSLSDWRLDNNTILKSVKSRADFLTATDHDFVNSEFKKLAEKNWIESYEWVEISIMDENYWYFHMTAYAKKFSQEILDILENTRNGRRSKIYKQIWLLSANWIDINEYDFFRFFEKKWINSFNLNIYHLASYIYRFERNKKRVKEIAWESLDKIEFLKRFLRNEGDYAHIWSATVEEYTPLITDVIDKVHDTWWILSIAHPNFSFKSEEFKSRILHFLDLWTDAIEINTRATEEEVKTIIELSGDWSILTFWSDCHFTPYSEEDHWSFLEMNPYVSEELVRQNIEKIRKRLK